MPGVGGGIVSDSYATGGVSGDDNVGGLVGLNEGGTVSNSYATGNVSGCDNVGGLIGSNRAIYHIRPVVSNSYWDVESSGIDESEGGIGLTTAQMKNNETFIDAGWDFEDTWSIDEDRNDGYPYLQWQEFDEEGSSNELILGIIIMIIVIGCVVFFVLRKRGSTILSYPSRIRRKPSLIALINHSTAEVWSK